MRWISILFGILGMCLLGLTACAPAVQQTKSWTPEEFKHVLDSVLAVRIPLMKQELWADFEIKKPILIKSVKDSILGHPRIQTEIILPSDTSKVDTTYDATENNISNE